MRAYAPDIPIIASVSLVENVSRIQQAGADFAMSVSQVAGQILAHHVLGETVSHQPRIKLLKIPPGGLEGSSPVEAQIRERTGCSVVAVERAGEICAISITISPCLLYTSPSPRDRSLSRMPSSA